MTFFRLQTKFLVLRKYILVNLDLFFSLLLAIDKLAIALKSLHTIYRES